MTPRENTSWGGKPVTTNNSEIDKNIRQHDLTLSQTPTPWEGRPVLNVISISGNIGCGKSSVINFLEQNPPTTSSFCFLDEPLLNRPNLLESFSRNPTDGATFMQIRTLVDYAIMKTEDFKIPVALRNNITTISERSPLDSAFVFTPTLYEQDTITKEGNELVHDTFNQIGWAPKHQIYLQCPPETCLLRTLTRQQPGDTNLSLDYLTTLHEKYEAFISIMSANSPNLVRTVDTSRDPTLINTEIAQIIQTIHQETSGQDRTIPQVLRPYATNPEEFPFHPAIETTGSKFHIK
jgi:deoxyadenosine/deoxycytidine kinase